MKLIPDMLVMAVETRTRVLPSRVHHHTSQTGLSVLSTPCLLTWALPSIGGEPGSQFGYPNENSQQGRIGRFRRGRR